MIPYDEKRATNVCERVPGYSGAIHYSFWTNLVAVPDWSSLLMFGVYHGRDLSMLCEIAGDYPKRQFLFTGVDKFNDESCADWPNEVKGKTWAEAGLGKCPDYATAKANIEQYRPPTVKLTICKSDEMEFIATHPFTYDFIYLDTAHDYDSVCRQVKAVKKLCHPKTILMGDDYTNKGFAGAQFEVRRAVCDSFTEHTVFGEWIWVGHSKHIKP